MEKIIVDATIFNSGSLADLRVVALITGIFATSHRTLAETAALWEIVE
jgi:hypothetical protein